MTTLNHVIPSRLNICLALLIIIFCALLLWASGQVQSWWAIGCLAVFYGFVMNTGYALCHEAEHDIFHPNKNINNAVGTVLSLFFPASFQLRRLGHQGHHLRNRSDDEAFDLYFEGEKPAWKYLQFYGILIGFFWLMIVFSNFIAAINPAWLAKKTNWDRPTDAFQETLNPKYSRLIQLEALLVLIFHSFMIGFFEIPFSHYFAVLFGFGFIWSTLQYIHHYETPRDVQKGARNVKAWRIFDMIWLNHHWHLNHHLNPTTPWVYLPNLKTEGAEPVPFWKAYFQQWRGPRFTMERVENNHAGKILQ
jgi:fatty acid desaturase